MRHDIPINLAGPRANASRMRGARQADELIDTERFFAARQARSRHAPATKAAIIVGFCRRAPFAL